MRCIEVAAVPCFYGAAAVSFVGKVFCLIILQIMHCTLANVEDFASAEATKGLSARPLETFGPILVEVFANQATAGFIFLAFSALGRGVVGKHPRLLGQGEAL